ncbi:MAG: hypothetical protein Fur006_32220 [Coleofasciculaceae cyanobacterium]
MSELLYDKSVSYKGYLIIPFVWGMVDSQSIYSYNLLSELGHKGKFHKSENPVGMYSNTLEGIVAIAKEHLDENSQFFSPDDYFKRRYTYRNNLIIVYEASGKYFYDHYNSDSLNNIAAPKIFQSEFECLRWIKQGLDGSQRGEETEKV